MTRIGMVLVSLLLTTAVALGADHSLVIKKTTDSPSRTLDRLTELLRSRGVAIVARVNHAAAAEKVGEALKPTELLIFGNPKLGTPLMRADRRIGLDLPMKELAWEDDEGQAWIAYVAPEHLKAEYGIAGHDEIFAEMGSALDKLTTEAAK